MHKLDGEQRSRGFSGQGFWRSQACRVINPSHRFSSELCFSKDGISTSTSFLLHVGFGAGARCSSFDETCMPNFGCCESHTMRCLVSRSIQRLVISWSRYQASSYRCRADDAWSTTVLAGEDPNDRRQRGYASRAGRRRSQIPVNTLAQMWRCRWASQIRLSALEPRKETWLWDLIDSFADPG